MRPPQVPRRHARHLPQLQAGDHRSAEVQERDGRALAELREDREDLPPEDGRQISELPENPEALPVQYDRQAAAVLSDQAGVPAWYVRPAAALPGQAGEGPEVPEVPEAKLRPGPSGTSERSQPALEPSRRAGLVLALRLPPPQVSHSLRHSQSEHNQELLFQIFDSIYTVSIFPHICRKSFHLSRDSPVD
jgi:hypothetical protein